jgi:tRNA (guanine37-N1)-methyltransferase
MYQLCVLGMFIYLRRSVFSMLAAYTKLQNAQKVKEVLYKKGVLNLDYMPVKEMGFIYFPVMKKVKAKNTSIVNTKFTFPQKEKKQTIETLLQKKLTKNQFSILPKSQEIVGSIMILEVPEGLEKKEKVIADAYLQLNKNITTVVKKTKIHAGVHRTRKVKILAGKRTKETVHHENGVKVKLHLEKVYFSARSGAERLRIANLLKKGEDVLVMFSGCAPFPLVIARNSSANHVWGIELNPRGHIYAVENVAMNKLNDMISVQDGDVRTIVPKLQKKFDRIVMPLPKSSEEFLYLALPAVKKGGWIHLYVFLDEKDIVSEAKRVKKMCTDIGYTVRIARKVKCGQFSPGTFRVCFDMLRIK